MDIEEINQKIGEISPSRCNLWDFSPTHSRFVVELRNAETKANAFLVLVGCVHISCATSWAVRHLQVAQRGPHYALLDEGVEVVFEHEGIIQERYDRG